MNETEAPLAPSPSVETLVDAPPPQAAPQPVPAAEAPAHAVARESVAMVIVSVLTLALVACLAVAHGWRKGYVLAPTDALRLVAPWETAGTDYVARNEQLLDQTVQFVPWTAYAVERLRRGEVPLWNPYSQLGAPFVGNGQSAVFYPTMLLHLTLPETWSWTIAAALKLFLAGLGTYVLAGRYRLRGVPRLLSAVAFMLCGFNVVWLNHPQTNVFCWLPWAVWLTELLVDRVTLGRFLAAAAVFAVQFLGGHPASCIHLLLTCGIVLGLRLVIPQRHPGQARGYMADVSRRRRVGRWIGSAAAFGGAVAFGLALAAAQWLPLIEYANHSGAQVIRKEKLAKDHALALDPRYLIGIAFPYANGFPDGVSPFEMRRATHLPNTNELAPGFVGTVPLLLALFAVVALRRRGDVILWSIVGLLAAAIAIKFPGIDHLVRNVPGLNVAQNARLLGVTALALAILAGLGLHAFSIALRAGVDYPRLRKSLTWTAAALAVLAILGALVLLVAKGPILNRGYAKAEQEYQSSAAHEHSLEHVKGLVRRVHLELVLTSARLLIPAAMLAVAAFLLYRHRRATQGQGHSLAASPWTWLGLATIDLLAFAIPFNPGSPAETYFPANVAAVEKLKQLPPGRFAGTFRTFIPETSTAYGLSDLRGYDALAPERYYRWWSHPGIVGLPAEAQGYLARLDDWTHPAWRLLNFGYLLTAPNQPAPLADKFKPLEGAGDTNLFQATTVRPRAWVAPKAETYRTADPVLDRVAKMDFDPDQLVLLDEDLAKEWPVSPDAKPPGDVWTRKGSASAAKVTFLPPPSNEQARPEIVRLQVSGGGGGYLILADSYFPGWRATIVDGSGTTTDVPILPAYGILRAVPLPPGASSVRVEFRYQPVSWRLGLMTSATAACLLLLLLGASLLPQRRESPISAQALREYP